MMHKAIVAAALASTMAFGAGSAIAQGGGKLWNELVAADRQAGAQLDDQLKAVCGGPIDRNFGLLTGSPGNAADDIRCQEVSVLVVQCTVLAERASNALLAARAGYATLTAQGKTALSRTGSADEIEAIYLAEHAAPGTTPADLMRALVSSCTKLLPIPRH